MRIAQFAAVVLAMVGLFGSYALAQEIPVPEDSEAPPIANSTPSESSSTSPSGVIDTASEEGTEAAGHQYNSTAPIDGAGTPSASPNPPEGEEASPPDIESTGSCEQYGCDQNDVPLTDIAPLTEEISADPLAPSGPASCDQYTYCDQYSNSPMPLADASETCAATGGCTFSSPPGLTCELTFSTYYGQYVYQCTNSVEPVQECTTYTESGYNVTECVPSSCDESHVYDEQGNYLTGTSLCGAYAVAERAVDDSAEVSSSLKRPRFNQASLVKHYPNRNRANTVKDTPPIKKAISPIAALTMSPVDKFILMRSDEGIGVGPAARHELIESSSAKVPAARADSAHGSTGTSHTESSKKPVLRTALKAQGYLAQFATIRATRSADSSGDVNFARVQTTTSNLSSHHGVENVEHTSREVGLLSLASGIGGVFALVGIAAALHKRLM